MKKSNKKNFFADDFFQNNNMVSTIEYGTPYNVYSGTAPSLLTRQPDYGGYTSPYIPAPVDTILPVYEQPIYVEPTPDYAPPPPSYTNPKYPPNYTPSLPSDYVQPVEYYVPPAQLPRVPVDYGQPIPFPVYPEYTPKTDITLPVYEQPIVVKEPIDEFINPLPPKPIDYQQQLEAQRLQAELDAALAAAQEREYQIQEQMRMARELEIQKQQLENQRILDEQAAMAAQSEAERLARLENARLAEEEQKRVEAEAARLRAEAEAAALKSDEEVKTAQENLQNVVSGGSVTTTTTTGGEITAPTGGTSTPEGGFADDKVTPATTLPVSKNLTPYIYAGLGIVVILIVARVLSKKS